MPNNQENSLLEERHVHDVYRLTSHYFVHNRYRAWPKVKVFIQNLPKGSLIADIGCGNGKYLHINSETYKIGADICDGLTKIASDNGHEVTVSNNLELPFRDKIFDAVLSIGVIHHFASKERRIEALLESSRILCRGGKILIYVMALEQERRKFEGQDVLIPWLLSPSQKLHKKDQKKFKKKDERQSSHRSDFHSLPLNSSKTIENIGYVKKSSVCTSINSSNNVHSTPVDKSHTENFHKRKNGKIKTDLQEDLSAAAKDSKDQAKNASLKDHFNHLPNMFFSKVMKIFNISATKNKPYSKSNQLYLSEKDEHYKHLINKIISDHPDIYLCDLEGELEHCFFPRKSTFSNFAVREFPQSSKPSCDKIFDNEIHEWLEKVDDKRAKLYKSTSNDDETCLLNDCPNSSFDSEDYMIHDFRKRIENDHFNSSEIHENGIRYDDQLINNDFPTITNSHYSEESHNSENKWETEWANITSNAIRVFEDSVARNHVNLSEEYDYIINSEKLGPAFVKLKSNGIPSRPFQNDNIIAEISLDSWHLNQNDKKGIRYSDKNSTAVYHLNSNNEVLPPSNCSESVQGTSRSNKSSLSSHSSSFDEVMTSDDDDSLIDRDLAVSNDSVFESSESKYHRYYHVFKKGELDELIKKHISCLKIIDSFYDHANWCVIAQKL